MGTSGAGMHFSGAMRCPKCWADMDQIMIDGTEIDRCSACHGLWFDAVELTDLATVSVSDFFKRFVTPERH
jgi:Zn-finger nucleic acid-binding protein